MAKEPLPLAEKTTKILIDRALWVQSDLEQAERRGIARDGGTEAAKNFWREWGAQEFDFLQRRFGFSALTNTDGALTWYIES